VFATVGAVINEVVPEAVLKTIWFAPPPATFVAVLTEMPAGSLHWGAVPVEVRINVEDPMASLERAVPVA
jgi:hypothetical protein